MSKNAERTPVLIGIGQSIERDGIVTVLDLASRAAEAALQDAPGLTDRIQRISMVGVSFSPVSMTPASEVAARLGLRGVHCETTTPGGNTPQWLVTRACAEIAAGELETTLIIGAEATRSVRKSDPSYDFIGASTTNRSGSDSSNSDEIIGPSIRGMLSAHEINAGLMRPADIYPVFESALAGRSGASPEAWREQIAAFMSRSSRVAETNPYAWFREGKEASEISGVSAHNRITAEPYTKCMNSFANVDQGSALLLTTLACAQEAGLAEQCIFPLSGASNTEVAPSARRDLAAAPAIGVAARAAMTAAHIGLDDIDCFDLYSCFPVAVELGAAEIGLALDDARGLTLTGGMSFFGGPGNNYTSHGISAAALRLREVGGLAYVSGNGGLLTKHSIGLYGSSPPARGFIQADTHVEQEKIVADAVEVVASATGKATVAGGTVIYDREGSVAAAPVIATTEDGIRVVAVPRPEILAGLAGRSLVGETVRLAGEGPPVYELA